MGKKGILIFVFVIVVFVVLAAYIQYGISSKINDEVTKIERLLWVVSEYADTNCQIPGGDRLFSNDNMWRDLLLFDTSLVVYDTSKYVFGYVDSESTWWCAGLPGNYLRVVLGVGILEKVKEKLEATDLPADIDHISRCEDDNRIFLVFREGFHLQKPETPF